MAGTAGGSGDVARPRAVGVPGEALVVLVALSWAAVRQGAFYAADMRILVSLVGAATLVGAARRRLHADPVVLGIAALAGWATALAVADGDAGAATWSLQLAVVVSGAWWIGAAVPRAARPAIVDALVFGGGVLGALCWWSVPDRWYPHALADGGLWRAAVGTTYANATASLLAMVALVAIARRAGGDRSAFTAVAATLTLVGLGATQSRGGLLAGAVGAIVLVVLIGARATARAGWAPVAGAVVAIAGLLPSSPESDPPRWTLAVVTLVVGLAVGAGADAVARAVPGRLRLAGIAALAMVGVVACAWSFGSAPALDGRLHGGFPDRHRADAWSTAFDRFIEEPVVGQGPGRLDLTYVDADGQVLRANFAHEEYLELAATLGLVGAVLGALAVVAASRAVARGRPAGDPAARAAWAGAVAAGCVLAVHSAFDFVWHVPLVPLVGALLVATATRPPAPARAPIHAVETDRPVPVPPPAAATSVLVPQPTLVLGGHPGDR